MNDRKFLELVGEISACMGTDMAAHSMLTGNKFLCSYEAWYDCTSSSDLHDGMAANTIRPECVMQLLQSEKLVFT